MKKLIFLFPAYFWAFLATAQQSIEIKPGQMSFKGQGADLNDRLTSDANGVANFKTKQELMIIRNYFYGGPLSFPSGVATRMTLSSVYHEKRNNTTSNVNSTDNTILIEETGMYLVDVNTFWPTVFAGDLVVRVFLNGIAQDSFKLKTGADGPDYQRFTGALLLTSGQRVHLELTQTNSTGTARSANFSISIIKL